MSDLAMIVDYLLVMCYGSFVVNKISGIALLGYGQLFLDDLQPRTYSIGGPCLKGIIDLHRVQACKSNWIWDWVAHCFPWAKGNLSLATIQAQNETW